MDKPSVIPASRTYWHRCFILIQHLLCLPYIYSYQPDIQ
jgi:hypothetical protein